MPQFCLSVYTRRSSGGASTSTASPPPPHRPRRCMRCALHTAIWLEARHRPRPGGRVRGGRAQTRRASGSATSARFSSRPTRAPATVERLRAKRGIVESAGLWRYRLCMWPSHSEPCQRGPSSEHTTGGHARCDLLPLATISTCLRIRPPSFRVDMQRQPSAACRAADAGG